MATPGLKESHIQKTVTDFLVADGWRPLRMEHAIERNAKGGFKRRVGEVGMPDYLYIRYEYRHYCSMALPPGCMVSRYHMAQVLWIEFKKSGKKPRPDQVAWHEAERARGGLVWVVDDIDSFRTYYEASGLRRR
jgi:hypothetical protein